MHKSLPLQVLGLLATGVVTVQKYRAFLVQLLYSLWGLGQWVVSSTTQGGGVSPTIVHGKNFGEIMQKKAKLQ